MTTPPVAAPPTTPPAPETTPPPETPAADKTLTQVEVDRIVADRVNREKAKFSDYADLKSKAQRLEQIEAANQTELEKAVEKARAEGRTEAQSSANTRLVAAEARALAAEAKFRNPATATRLLDLSGVAVGDDGTVDADAIKALLDDLAKAEPYLLAVEDGSAPPPTATQVGVGVTGTPVATDPRVADLAQIEADMKASKRHR